MTIQIKPHLSVTCSHCQKSFQIKYNQFHKQYYQKNNLDYWTEKESDQRKYICNESLRHLYFQEKWKYLELIPNPKKRQQLRIYLSKGTI
ncbi:MAG: hypothetical protein mread185_000465 [Mycoplasmataceae bacterium]|nr:MAG: hypothetical protein mread185_000465 [Mycoplasmataceae bacterium]